MNLGLSVRLENLAPSQYADWTFTSLVTFDGKVVAFGPDGVCELGGETDNGAQINAVVELPTVDLGRQGRLRSAEVGYQTAGTLRLETTADERHTTTYELPARQAGEGQQAGRVPLKRTTPGRYWGLAIENVAGCDFSLDSLELRPVMLGRRGRC